MKRIFRSSLTKLVLAKSQRDAPGTSLFKTRIWLTNRIMGDKVPDHIVVRTISDPHKSCHRYLFSPLYSDYSYAVRIVPSKTYFSCLPHPS